MQSKKLEIQQLKKKFKSKSHDIQSLFLSDLSRSKRLTANTTEFMQGIFLKLNNILLNNKLLPQFKKYLLDQFNIPIQINLKFLKYQQFARLFQEWIQSVESGKDGVSLAQSQLLSSNQYTFRNKKFQQILKLKSQYITEYAQIVSNHKRFSDFDLNQLLRQLFMEYYLYQLKSDFQVFFQKTNSFSALLQIIKQYRNSQRNNSLIQDPKFIYVSQIPNFLIFWQQKNNQLSLQQQQRKKSNTISTQTQFKIINQQKVENQNQDLEQILNKVLNMMQNKKQQIYNNQIAQQSIQKIIASIKRQRIILYPKYKKVGFFQKKLISRQKTNQLETIIKNKLQKILRQIYSYYLNQPKYPNDFDDKLIRYRIYDSVFDTKKIHDFLEDVGILQKFQYPRSGKLVSSIKNNISNPNQILFHQFFGLINQLMDVQSQFTIDKLQKFVDQISQNQRSIKSKKIITQISDNVLERVNHSRNLDHKDQVFIKNQPKFSFHHINAEKSPNSYGKRYLKKSLHQKSSINEKSIKKSNTYSTNDNHGNHRIESTVPIIMIKQKPIKQQFFEKGKVRYMASNSGNRKQ